MAGTDAISETGCSASTDKKASVSTSYLIDKENFQEKKILVHEGLFKKSFRGLQRKAIFLAVDTSHMLISVFNQHIPLVFLAYMIGFSKIMDMHQDTRKLRN